MLYVIHNKFQFVGVKEGFPKAKMEKPKAEPEKEISIRF